MSNIENMMFLVEFHATHGSTQVNFLDFQPTTDIPEPQSFVVQRRFNGNTTYFYQDP